MHDTAFSSETFVRKVDSYCREHSLLPAAGGTIVAAVSGGGDSMVLLSVLVELSRDREFRVVGAHLNHALRGRESDGDQEFVRDFCNAIGITFVTETLSPGTLEQKKESLESAARAARLDFLARTASDCGAKRIATGHSLDDQAETILQRLIRGTGPGGLKGILPLRDDLWCRPLLMCTRDEIRSYAQSAGIRFREDSSNDDHRFTRNRIRHELMPLITERFSLAFRESAGRLAELSRQQEDYFDTVVGNAFSECVILANPFKILLDKSRMEDYHNIVKQRIVRHALMLIEGKGRDTDLREIDAVMSELENSRCSMDISAKIRFGVERGVVIFTVPDPLPEPADIHLHGTMELPSGGGSISVSGTRADNAVDGISSVLVSHDIIETHGPLTAGPVVKGERMKPFGMKETVKISDCIAQAVPKILRHQVPVIRAGAIPVWIPGVRSSELLRIPDSESGTVKAVTSLLRLEFHNGITRTMFNR